MLSILGLIGRFATEQIAGMGAMFSFLMSAVFLAFRRPAKIYLIIYHIKTIGVESLSVVALSASTWRQTSAALSRITAHRISLRIRILP